MSELSLLSLLRQLPYFAHTTELQLGRLAAHAIHHPLFPGRVIFLEGDESLGLWILEKGRVKAYKLSADGQEYILRFFGPGDTFNDLAAFDGAPNNISTMAVTDGSAWSIPTDVFINAIQTDHELCLAMLRGLTSRARQLVSQIEDLALRPVTARLARFLLGQVENPTLSHPAITRALIAKHLATTPETITRSLRVLEEIGAIRFDRHNIVISRPNLLHELALI
jgi:CRP/FNR family transcriptional regulator